MSEEKILPWTDDSLTDTEHEDCAVILMLIKLYMLGYAYSHKTFKIFNEHFCTEVMSIKDSLDFMTQFENRFSNEVWFQYYNSRSRRAALARRLESGEGR